MSPTPESFNRLATPGGESLTPMFVADAMSAPQATDRQSLCAGIAHNWYEDCLDEDPYERDLFWFESGAIAVEVGSIQELPAQHYDVLNLYLSDLTPSDTTIAEAIAYKSATFSPQP